LLGIGLLRSITWEAPVGISRTSRFHSGGTTAEFLEHRPVALFVADLITAKDGSALEFAARISFRQLAILFDADVKDASHVGLLTTLLGLSLDILPLLDLVLVPAALAGTAGLRDSPETIPLCL